MNRDMRQLHRNQKDLIDILNHNVTRMTNDIYWLKKIIGWEAVMITGCFVSLIGIIIKSFI